MKGAPPLDTARGGGLGPLVTLLAAAALFGVSPPELLAVVAAIGLVRGHALAAVLACAVPLAGRLGLFPAPWQEHGLVASSVAALAIVAAERHARLAGERPHGAGSSRALALGAMVAAADLLAWRVAGILGAARTSAWAPIALVPVVVGAEWLARSPRATRALRDRIRDASLVAFAAATVVAASNAPVPFALFALVGSGATERLPRGAAFVALAFTALLRASREGLLHPDIALAGAALFGVLAPHIRSVVLPGFGERARLLERARGRLADHDGQRTHRVARALAEPTPRFLIDWHDPPAQLVVERIGVLRLVSALPAPEVVEALAAAPLEVLAAEEVHPYVVGAVDVQATLRSFEVRGASAAALLRDAESGEALGVLYLLDGTRAPLSEEEADRFAALARAVSFSLVAGTEPAIAARIRP